MRDEKRFSYVLSLLPGGVAAAVSALKNSGTVPDEIRLRAGKPAAVTVAGESFFLSAGGHLSTVAKDAFVCAAGDIDAAFLRICDGSVFAHTKEIEEGFIAAKGGLRAGVCGDFSAGALPRVGSINIRIPREAVGCAKSFADAFCGGMLIAGPPGCGKTTVLRDLIKTLSNRGRRVAVIDSRREISGGEGEFAFDLGGNTDVIFMQNKARGTQMALRSMYPQIIAFDEVGTAAETAGILEAFSSGVDIITTAHAGSIEELKTRPVTRELLGSGTVKTVVMLPRKIASRQPAVYSIKEGVLL